LLFVFYFFNPIKTKPEEYESNGFIISNDLPTSDKEALKHYINKFKLISSKKYIIPFPIYYINMDKDTDRLNSVLQHSKTYVKANLTRIRAFNGNLITNRKSDTVDGITFLNYYKELSRSEIGCCISHLMAINTAWKNGDKIAMIIEDDLSFSSTAIIPKIGDIIKNAPKDWDILQLSSFENNNNTPPKSKINYTKRNYPTNAFWSCGCYIINRKAMETILNITKPDKNKELYIIKPIRNATVQEIENCKKIKYTEFTGFPLFGVSDGYIYDLVNTYATSPSLFIMDNSELESTIHESHTPYHIQNALITAKTLDSLYLK
jgi:hypothetical protein